MLAGKGYENLIGAFNPAEQIVGTLRFHQFVLGALQHQKWRDHLLCRFVIFIHEALELNKFVWRKVESAQRVALPLSLERFIVGGLVDYGSAGLGGFIRTFEEGEGYL